MSSPIDPRTRDCIASRFRAGDSIADMAEDYGVQVEQVEAALREALFPAPQPAPTTGDGRDVVLDLLEAFWRGDLDVEPYALAAERACAELGWCLPDALKARRKQGIATYGIPLQPHNGRDAKRDKAEELLDALIYLWQERMEKEKPHG